MMNGLRMALIAVPVALMLGACGSEYTDEAELTATEESELSSGKLNPIGRACIVSGCSSQVCSDRSVITTCEWRPEYACYRDATCERQANGQCGWTMDDELSSCLGNGGTTPGPISPIAPAPVNPCMVTGCSSQVCANQPVATTCEWRPEYACYAKAACEQQARGVCGWTMTDELKKCLANAGGSPVLK